MQACLLALLVVAATQQAGAQAASDVVEPTSCPLDPGPRRAVTSVIDGETITLDDGSEVRLIGALTPRPPDSALDISYWQPERDAKAELERLALGRSVTLGFSGRRTDRYGRTLAHVFVDTEGEAEPVWLQGRMLSSGHARAFVLQDNPGCLRELVAHEAIARQAGAGLWSHAAYHVRDAARAFDLMRLRSTFQIVEGEVTEVIAGKASLILRFGRDDGRQQRPGNAEAAADEQRQLPRGFSLAIRHAVARRWSAGGITLALSLGHRLRIRGWIERRGGPAIEIIDSHQIELVDVAALHAVAAAVVDTAPRRRSRRKAAPNAPAQE